MLKYLKRRGGLFIKKIVIMFIFLLSIPILFNIKAENKCVELTYYANKEWVQYYDFIDVPFDEKETIIINSKSISFKRNVFGTLADPRGVHHSSFDGTSSYSIKNTGTKENPNIFQIDFGKKIRIGKIKLKIEAKNNHKNIRKYIYVNGYPEYVQGIFTVKGTPRLVSDEKDFILLDLKKEEINNIVITFDYDPDTEYSLSYFQIEEYESYETTGWTTDVIDNTETKKIIACSGDGTFDSDGTKSWVRSASTIFSPAVSLVSDYVPILANQSVEYDWGRGNTINAYSSPEIVKEIGGNARKIRGFSELGVRPYNRYESYGDGNKEFPYIMIDDKRGVQYIVSPMYWSTSILSDYAYASSTDRNWCNHVLGTAVNKCYKHYGHISNARRNVYDVKIRNFKDITNPELRVIKKSEYYLINEDTKEEIYLKSGVNEVQLFDFDTTGRWRIKALISDLADNVGTKLSELFLIDKEKPDASFEIEERDGKQSAITVTPNDQHSGVKRWKIEISKDGGKTFIDTQGWMSQANKKILLNSGDYQLKVDIEDNAGNINTVYSAILSVWQNEASLKSLLALSYEVGVQTPIYMEFECEGCVNEPNEVMIYQDNKHISTHKLSEKINKIQTDFMPTNPISTVLSFKTLNQTVDLHVMEITKEVKESDNGYIDFEGIVASGIDMNSNEYFYSEHLIVSLFQDKRQIMSGEGIEFKVNIQYQNECSLVEDFKCKQGNINNLGGLDSHLNYGSATSTFQEGASYAKDSYQVESGYRVPLIVNKDSLRLPEIYLDKKSGETFLTPNEYTINGGYKWYSNPQGECKTYDVIIEGKEIAVNRFNYFLNSNYEITHPYYEDFRIHFSEPDDPFKNGYSDKWKDSLQWFKDLSLSNPIKQFILDK